VSKLKDDQESDNSKKKIRPRVKIWLEVDGEVVFGNGRTALFQAIEDKGSIKQAAEEIGMSYRAAWGKIKATEERLGIKLVERHAGGRNSGAELTPKGKELLKLYSKFREDAAASINDTLASLFNEF